VSQGLEEKGVEERGRGNGLALVRAGERCELGDLA